MDNKNSKILSLNGWQRIGICVTFIYLVAFHICVYMDSNSPPKSSVLDPAKVKISTSFYEWSINSSNGITVEQYRKEKGLQLNYKLSEEEFFELLPDKWVHSFKITPYPFWFFVPILLGWGFVYIELYTMKWIISGFRNGKST